MSFILDALRKSEHARQKQTGPALAEVPRAAPKSRTNVWALAAVALLIVNLVAVGVLLLRRAAQPADATAATPVAPAPATPNPTPTLNDGGPTTVTATPPTAAPLSPPPAPSPAGDGGRNPLAAEVGLATPDVDPTLAAAAAAVPAGPPAVTRQAAATAPRRGTVTYAPIPEASDAPYSPPPAPSPAPATRAADNMPTADEVTARGGAPALHLDLHVYSTVPQQRFIFVNSRKYREGETLQEGPRVEQITLDGAVLEYQGSRFRLSND